MNTTTTLADLLNARYSPQQAALLPPMPELNSTLHTLLSHRSIRSFLPKPLLAGTVELLVAAGQSAASSSNLQMWSVVAIEDKERIARLGQNVLRQKHVERAPLLLVYLADLAILADTAKIKQQPLEGIDYLDTFLMAALDAVLAAQNAVVAAESLGLGTVFGGGIRNDPEFVINELQLPEYVFPIVSLSVGYPDPERLPKIKPRLPQSAVLHREHYSSAPHPAAVEAYDPLMEQFFADYRMPGTTWSGQSLARLRDPQALSGRDTLRTSINARRILLK